MTDFPKMISYYVLLKVIEPIEYCPEHRVMSYSVISVGEKVSKDLHVGGKVWCSPLICPKISYKEETYTIANDLQCIADHHCESIKEVESLE